MNILQLVFCPSSSICQFGGALNESGKVAVQGDSLAMHQLRQLLALKKFPEELQEFFLKKLLLCVGAANVLLYRNFCQKGFYLSGQGSNLYL